MRDGRFLVRVGGIWALWRLLGPRSAPAFGDGQEQPAAPAGRTVRAGGHEFFVREAGPAEGPRVLLLHGWALDSLAAWHRVIPLLDGGFRVVAVDLRGQGGSERLLDDPLRSHVTSFKGYDTDVRTLMRDLVMPHCPAPHFALGHSTGGHVLLRLLRRDKFFARVVVCSPLLGILYGRWPRPVAALLVFLACSLGLGWLYLPGQRKRPLGRSDFGVYPLTSDRRRWQRDSGILEVTPHLGVGAPTFGWLRAARRSVAALRWLGRHSRLTAPVLILAAGADRIVSNAAIKAFAARGQRPDISFWRSHDGLEVDLLIRDGPRLHPVEIKLTATPTARHLEPLNRLKALMGTEAAEQGLLVCTCDAERPLPGGNLAMPWQRFPAWIAGLLGEGTAQD